MTSKTIAFKQPSKLTKPAEEWVQAKQPATKPAGPTKRLTVDVDDDLHRRIKIDCAQNDTKIADVVRDLLMKAYPET